MSSVKPLIASFSSLSDQVRTAGARRKLIGFDVFDTLLRRRIEPETIKDLTAKHLVRLLAGIPTCAPLRPWGMPDWKLLREKRRFVCSCLSSSHIIVVLAFTSLPHNHALLCL